MGELVMIKYKVIKIYSDGYFEPKKWIIELSCNIRLFYLYYYNNVAVVVLLLLLLRLLRLLRVVPRCGAGAVDAPKAQYTLETCAKRAQILV